MRSNIYKRNLPEKVYLYLRFIKMKAHRRVEQLKGNINKAIQLLLNFNHIRKRRCLYKKFNHNQNHHQKLLVDKVTSVGIFSGRLSDFYKDHENLIEYLQKMCNNSKLKTFTQLETEGLKLEPKHDNASKVYFVNLYHPFPGGGDPIKDFMTSPEIFLMAAKYLGEIPQVMMLDVLYTPRETETAINAMLWHKDRHHDSVFRIFINPFDMLKDNGATMAFPKSYIR
jgi:hypothetical protein